MCFTMVQRFSLFFDLAKKPRKYVKTAQEIVFIFFQHHKKE